MSIARALGMQLLKLMSVLNNMHVGAEMLILSF